MRDVWDRFPQIKTQYGWRRDVTPDHPAGRAIDVIGQTEGLVRVVQYLDAARGLV